MRRAILQDRVKATSENSTHTLYGKLLHELFQEAMKANAWSDSAFERYMDAILPRHYATMVEVGLNLNQVREHLKSKLPEIQGWAETYVRESSEQDAIIKGRNGQQLRLSVNRLLDVEERIWSPNYGLKGNIDATVQATIHDGTGSRVLTVPFEMKTGKNVKARDRAQTSLYPLLTSDRYGELGTLSLRDIAK